jgi:nucleotidyltransferase substrate binding protein (TIGR01987 family)
MADIIILTINVSPLIKAFEKFEKFRKHIMDEQDRAGAIQAFEFCFELAWKTLKRILMQKGVEVRSPRDAFREAAANQLIGDPKLWFQFLEKRNLTVHTYEEKVALEITAIFSTFSQEVESLLKNIMALHE